MAASEALPQINKSDGTLMNAEDADLKNLIRVLRVYPRPIERRAEQ
jgi:hypothetical protein